MKFIHTDQSFKQARRDLRDQTTIQEKILWRYLRGSRLGYKFRRQHSIGPYIVDFYCAQKRLIIEIDGSQHSENEIRTYDQTRTEYLESLHHKVLRFWNNDINTNINAVLDRIQKALQ